MAQAVIDSFMPAYWDLFYSKIRRKWSTAGATHTQVVTLPQGILPEAEVREAVLAHIKERTRFHRPDKIEPLPMWLPEYPPSACDVPD
jgi:hypothetical protein